MSKRVRAWHILPDNRKLTYDDNRLITKGSTVKVQGDPVLCYWGLHGSRKLISAILYAESRNCSSNIICRVELSGGIKEDKDKLVARSRKCLWWVDATHILHKFSANLVKDYALKHCFEAKMNWLDGKISTEKLRKIRLDYYNWSLDINYYILSTDALRLFKTCVGEFGDAFNDDLEKLVWEEHRNNPRRLRNVRTLEK